METAPVVQQKSSPKDVFLHLLMVGTLYVAVTSFITLLFQYVNAAFPDELYYYEPVLGAIRWSTAVLLIVFPVYLYVSRLIGNDLAADPAKRDIRVRKWLLHLTLFIAAIAVIVDLVALIYNFLSGELTLRFFLKIAIVFAVASAVFKYYLWELRRVWGDASAIPRIAAWASAAVLLAAIIGGFSIVGSPFRERAVRLDERRVNDLQAIQSQVVAYWQAKQQLPASLDDLKDSITGFTPPRDPETEAAYEYRATSDASFELCATFATERRSNADAKARIALEYPYGAYGENWDHGEGRACFARTIDPDRYPKIRD